MDGIQIHNIYVKGRHSNCTIYPDQIEPTFELEIDKHAEFTADKAMELIKEIKAYMKMGYTDTNDFAGD